MENDKKQRDYTYLQREEDHELDGKGQVKSTETKTYEIMELYGGQVERLIAKNDKPLSQKDAAKEEAKIQKVINKRKNESEDDRKKRLEKEEKSREEDRQLSLMPIPGRDFSPTIRVANIFPNSAFAPGSTRRKCSGQSSISSALTRSRGGCLSPASTRAHAS